MNRKFSCGFILIALAVVLAAPAQAQVAPYSQDFEGLVWEDPAALGDDGWLVFGNVFSGVTGGYLFGYGPFPAPNPGGGFSTIDRGQGGPDQGDQQLSVYSDYNNVFHGSGDWVEANVFQERVVTADNVGQTWVFRFDAKRGDINDPADPKCPCSTTAFAFIKTINPAAGFALTNFVTIDTTNLPETWGSYKMSLEIDPSLPGQFFQFGFLNTATLFEPSGVFYDNIVFRRGIGIDIKPGGYPNSVNPSSLGLIPVAILGSASFDVADIDVTALAFGPDGAAPAHDLLDPDVYAMHAGDMNMDGYTDLVVHFHTQESGIDFGDTEATLIGATLDGQPFEGTDSVNTLVARGRWLRPFDQEAQQHLATPSRTRTKPRR